ncbi:MAG: dTDP-4-dehydrorhamnose 3,5-epimerase [Myxococcales bacterium]|nr:dTDP-4-dehydrorhamnose 3,5-epimerase [Myxococcales bacterium]
MGFHFERGPLDGPVLIRADVYHDDRGFFFESYKRSAFVAEEISVDFVQDNVSHSRRGVLRGLHFQKPPHAQGKLVCALAGRIFDVAVDIRDGSPTFGRWQAVELSDENRSLFWVPEGFAHAFLVLSETATVIYKVTREYAPTYDSGIRWDDPSLAITWPIAEPLVSPKDARLGTLAECRGAFPR